MTKGINGDFDSDTILLTDNTKLIELAKRHYNEFKVPTNLTTSSKIQRYYTTEQKVDLDIRTSVNKIGEIVNLSQQLNSLMWDKINHGATIQMCNELYEDICKLAVLSNVEIDRAKKEFVINSGTEIRILKEKYSIVEDGMPVKPKFFQMICMENGYKLSDNIKYRSFETAMDYLQDIVSKYNFNKSRGVKKEIIPFIEIVKKPEGNYQREFYYMERDKTLNAIKQAKLETKILFIGFDYKTSENYDTVLQRAEEIKLACIDNITKMSETKAVMYLVLKELENPENREASRYVFEVLFAKPNESFFSMIHESKEEIYTLKEDPDGELVFYGIHFTKQPIIRIK